MHTRIQDYIRHSHLKGILSLIPLLFILFFSPSTQASQWRELTPGIEYIDLGANLLTPWSHIHVFRVDLRNYQLGLVMANRLSHQHASVDELTLYSNALLGINGGFFDRSYHPLGLRVSDQQQYNALKQISWWGVFYIKNKKAYLTNPRQYNQRRPVDFAIQSGPRLLINGRIPSLKGGNAERSALGITPDGRVIILVTDHAPMNTTALAEIFKAEPLNCKQAINLDGGSSSQLYAHINSFKINVHGFSNVTDAIIVKPYP